MSKVQIPFGDNDSEGRIRVSLSKPELVRDGYTGQRGCYVSVRPQQGSLSVFRDLCKQLGIECVEDKLHCTVMYSREASLDDPKDAETDPTAIHWGLITGLDHWGGHDNKPYIVATVISPALYLQNAKFQRAGAVHSFMPYKAHVTLSSDVPLDDTMLNRIENVNRYLSQWPKQVLFHDLVVADVKGD